MRARWSGLGLGSVVAVASAVALGGGACDVYDPSLLEPVAPDGPTTKNGVGWWSRRAELGCFSAGAPRPEDRPPPHGDGDVGPIYLALESMRLGSVNEQGAVDPNAWKDIGFDLDGACTASDTCPLDVPPQSCRAGASALPRDGNYCRDNVFARLEHAATLIPELTETYGLSDDAFNCALCVGHYNFLFRLTGYNGEENDDRVRIDVYPSPGLERPLPWDCTQPDWKTRLCFTPDMPWTIQEDVPVEPRPGPDLAPSKIFDDAAYVRDGYVVARLPEQTLFWFPGYKAVAVAFPLRIQGGVVTGRLARGPDGVWRVSDGIIAGRVLAGDIVNGFRLIGFCDTNDPTNYEVMTTFVTTNLDVTADGRRDPDAPCDAMSLGIAFTALQARAGGLEAVSLPVECSPSRDRDAGVDGAADAGF